MAPPPLPPGHRRIGLQGLNNLTLDDQNQLHWNNVKLKTELHLTMWQRIVAVAVALAAFLASIASLADSYVKIAKPGEGIVVGPPPTLNASGIYFYEGLAALRPDSNANLERIAAALVADPSLVIEIDGYTDNVGSEAQNLTLSEERAASVAQWLYGAGIARTRVRSRGFGEANPIADNGTAEGRAANRRVEIVRVETTGQAAHSGGGANFVLPSMSFGASIASCEVLYDASTGTLCRPFRAAKSRPVGTVFGHSFGHTLLISTYNSLILQVIFI